jgi:hypothetical protein
MTQSIREVDIPNTRSGLATYIGVDQAPHYALRGIEGHMHIVDSQGLLKKRTAWKFNGTIVWGPMTIVGTDENGYAHPASVDIATVRGLVRWG